MTTLDTSREVEAREFYNGALHRVQRSVAVLAVPLALGAFLRYGASMGVPFCAGALLGWLNLVWMARGSTDLLTRIAALSSSGAPPAKPPGTGGAVFRFVLRYLLVGAAGYAIFNSSVFSILGLFTGLFLPVAALMLEAFYELWVSYRRGL